MLWHELKKVACTQHSIQRCVHIPVDLCIPACQCSSIFLRIPCSRVPVRHFFCIPLCSSVPVSRSYAPVSTSVCVGGRGATHHMRAVSVWTDQVGQVNSPLRSVQVYWREAGLRSNSCLVHNSPPSTSPLSTRLVLTVSVLHRNANSAFVVFCVPRSCVPV